MRRLATGVLLSAAVFLGGLSFASAETIEVSHNVYHIKACPDRRRLVSLAVTPTS